MKEDQNTLGLAMGRIASSCAILTVVHDGVANGMLVSWIQQAAFDPPSVTVCLSQDRPAVELIDASKKFLLNIIGDDPSELFKHFGKGFALDKDPFSGLSVRDTSFGPLIETCIAHLGCEVTDKVTVGDHYLYVAEVVGGGVVEGARPYTHLRKSGFSY